MFSVSIAFGTQNWRLLFKSEDKAEAAYVALTAARTHTFNPGSTLELIDDFGQRATLSRDAITGIMFENLDQTKLANVEYGLHGARTQSEFQKRAHNDPSLRTGMQGSPSIISPMPGGNGRMI